MIVSGESSGELYGAMLAKALKNRNPDIIITGVGGDRMQAAGVSLISRISSSFGITEAIKTYSEIRETFKSIVSYFKTFKPQVVVLIDYPDFNMKVAKEAKKLGIKVLYYVSPQVWAWRKGRVKTIGRFIDKMAVILPFEEEIYRNEGIPCEFVGHPVFDEIREVLEEIRIQKSEVRGQKTEDRSSDMVSQELKLKVRKELGLHLDEPVMVLMPGSRTHEIKKLLPVMYDVITKMKEMHPDYQFVIPVAPNLGHDTLSAIDEFKRNAHHTLHFTHNAVKALMASDIAVIASGTSALQAALIGVPMVIVYKLSPLTYFIGRLVVKIRHISLVNILLDYLGDHGLRVRELLQRDANVKNILEEVSRIITDSDYSNMMLSQLKKVRELFFNKQASLQVACIVEELGNV
ncbi:lipid-A-disaccharide synthase [hot springs metagenome]|uniref:lipid-A-disaccharide synthase n=1 Tax=hot springs metagenome TaxID=433727 RepID=A0A5J4KYR1_9ZZZZ